MQTTSWIEISESALKNNVDFIHHLIGDQVQFSAVVKGNAYGHGIEIYCPLAYKLGVRHFSTFDAFEARRVLNSVDATDGITVMVMGSLSDEQMAWAIEEGVHFFVFNKQRLELAAELAKKIGKKAKIHLEFETGMNRTGFSTKYMRGLFQQILSNQNHIEVIGICSHLAGAESIANYKRVKDQWKRFNKVKLFTDKVLDVKPTYHLACSAAMLRYPKTRFDLVRLGILQYGYFPTNEVHIDYIIKNKVEHNPLQRIISWKTRIMEIKEVKMGEFIGYGTSFFANNAKRVAIIPVGYASGYARSLSNNGKVIIRGVRLDVIGMVNMNMLAVDITGLEGGEIGDEVVLIGIQGNTEITVSSFSEFSHLVNYELLTRLPNDIHRLVTT